MLLNSSKIIVPPDRTVVKKGFLILDIQQNRNCIEFEPENQKWNAPLCERRVI